MFLLLCLFKLFLWAHSWVKHFQLANVIADWHQTELKLKMKRAGIKPRWAPLPNRLAVLPCNLMVLSAVMVLMSRVGLDPFVSLTPPVTWVEAFGGIRSLLDSLPFTQPPPPEPPPNPFVATAGDGEGDDLTDCASLPSMATTAATSDADGDDGHTDCACGCVNHLQCLDPAALEEVLSCQFIHGPALSNASSHLKEPDVDIEKHVATGWRACWASFSQWPLSFGPLGLLSDASPDASAIVDTGASMCVTPHAGDFVSYKPVSGKVLKGLTRGTTVQGIGLVSWKIEIGGKIIELKLRALHVPECDVRLLSPQQLRQEYPSEITLMDIQKQCVRIEFPEGVFDCPLNESNLPVMRLTTPTDSESNVKAFNACVMAEANQNLTPSQKELLKWHSKLGHIDLKQVQRIMKTGALGWTPLIKAASNVDLNKTPLVCGSCAFAKAKRRASRPKRDRAPHHSSNHKDKILSKDILRPGQKVSMDHFIVSTPGRLFSSRGSEGFDRMYKGGVIFKDHASGHVVVEPVVNFTAGEAIRAKKSYEREMASMGVTVIHYHTDNGVFTSSEFQDELAGLEQGLSLSGVGAHHQNSMAEREIGIVFSLARTMMLHAKLRWPKAVTAKLWPMVLKHTQHLVNHIPGTNNVCPLDLVLGTTVPREHLRNLHVWGAPAYVLHPKLQDGGKIPKWDPRSRQGLHLGWSPLHASTVPLILNLTTGHVSPQFHVIFDDWFSTVSTEDKDPTDDIESKVWTELFNDNRFLAHFDDEDPIDLDDEWLTELERLERHQKATARVQRNVPPTAEELPSDMPQAPTRLPDPTQQSPTTPATPDSSQLPTQTASGAPPTGAPTGASPAAPASPPPFSPPKNSRQQRETKPKAPGKKKKTVL